MKAPAVQKRRAPSFSTPRPSTARRPVLLRPVQPGDVVPAAGAAMLGGVTLSVAGSRAAGDVRRRREVPVALVLFALLSGALFWRLLAHVGTSTTGTNDSYILVWWLAWVPHALLHGHDVLVSGALFAPHGVNALWNTSVLALGVVLAPLTVLAGPVVALNVAVVLSPVVSALACFLVARRWVRVGPALLAGLVYGFSPFVLGQSRGHLHLTVAWFPPLVLAVLAEALGPARVRPARLGVLLGVAIAVQLLVSEEVLASTALVTGISMVLLVVPPPDRLRERVRALAAFSASAVASAVLLCAVPLAVQFRGPQAVHGSVQPVPLGADLLQLVVPSPLELLHVAVAGVRFSNLSEQTSYLGLPLLLMLVLAHVRLAGSPLRVLEVPAAVAVVLSLGTRLVVGGHDTGLPLPGAVLEHVPVLDSLVPVRFSEHVALFAALLLAATVDRAAAPGVPSATAVGAVAVVVALLPASPVAAYAATTPAFFTRPRDVALLPAHEPVVVTPYPYAAYAGPMLWQARAGERFDLVGGYGVVPGPGGVAAFGLRPPPLPQLIQDIAQGQSAPPLGLQRACVEEVRRDHVAAVVLAPMAYDTRAAATVARLLRWPRQHLDGVWLVGPRPGATSPPAR